MTFLRPFSTFRSYGGHKAWPPSVYLSFSADDTILETVRDGSVLVLMQSESSTLFPSIPTRFKQAWWLGNQQVRHFPAQFASF